MPAEDVQEPADDPQMKDILYWTGTVFYWIFWPIGISVYYFVYYVSFVLLFIIKLLYRPLEFVLLPVVYFVQFLFACMLAPFQFAARFETLYIYLGIAAIVGIALGVFVSFVYNLLRKPLGLDQEPQPPGRTAKEYRIEQRKRKAKAEAPLVTAGYLSPSYLSMSDGMRKGNRGKGLLSQTIMEEVDSDY